MSGDEIVKAAMNFFTRWQPTPEQLEHWSRTMSQFTNADPADIQQSIAEHWHERGSYPDPVLRDAEEKIKARIRAGKRQEHTRYLSFANAIRKQWPAWQGRADCDVIIRYYRALWLRVSPKIGQERHPDLRAQSEQKYLNHFKHECRTHLGVMDGMAAHAEAASELIVIADDGEFEEKLRALLEAAAAGAAGENPKD